MKVSSVFLLATTLLTGFLGGIGFVNFIGFGPALRDTPAKHLVPHWQIVDSYMRVRMPIFGSVILVFLTGSVIFLLKQPYKMPVWFLVLALLFILIDVLIAVRYNFPFNRLIQRIDPGTIPDTFEYYRGQAVFGFLLRSCCMVGCFASMLAALFFQASKGLLR